MARFFEVTLRFIVSKDVLNIYASKGKLCYQKKLDTRRKILVGAYYLDKARKENTFDETKKMKEPKTLNSALGLSNSVTLIN